MSASGRSPPARIALTFGAPSSPRGTVPYSIFTPVFSSRYFEKRLVVGSKLVTLRVMTDRVVLPSPKGSVSRAFGPT